MANRSTGAKRLLSDLSKRTFGRLLEVRQPLDVADNVGHLLVIESKILSCVGRPFAGAESTGHRKQRHTISRERHLPRVIARVNSHLPAHEPLYPERLHKSVTSYDQRL